MDDKKPPKRSEETGVYRERGSFLSLAQKLYKPTFLRGKKREQEELLENEYFRMLNKIESA